MKRLTPSMRETLIALLNRNMYPVNRNNSRTFEALEERGLVHPDFFGLWSLTDLGHRTALGLLRR